MNRQPFRVAIVTLDLSRTNLGQVSDQSVGSVIQQALTEAGFRLARDVSVQTMEFDPACEGPVHYIP